MKLDLLKDGSDDCPLIRLYEFRSAEIQRLREAFTNLASRRVQHITLDQVTPVESIDGTKLSFTVGPSNRGVTIIDHHSFDLVLVSEGWQHCIDLISPFVSRVGVISGFARMSDVFGYYFHMMVPGDKSPNVGRRMSASLPIEYERPFSLQLYWVSHGPLLLRSGKNEKHTTRIDILFQDVRWMALPVWFEGIRIERGEISEIPLPLTAKIQEEAHLMSVFRVISQGVTHYVLAGGVSVAQDEKAYFEDSSLLPHLDFRAFVAHKNQPIRRETNSTPTKST